MSGFEPPGEARSYGDSAGEVTLWFPADGVAAARAVGYIPGGVAAAVYAEIDRVALAREHPRRGFVDFSGMTGFDWDAKAIMVRWNVAHRQEAARFDVLTGSWILHAVLAALGKVLGDRLVSHAERSTFDAAYNAELRRASERIRRARLSTPP